MSRMEVTGVTGFPGKPLGFTIYDHWLQHGAKLRFTFKIGYAGYMAQLPMSRMESGRNRGTGYRRPRAGYTHVNHGVRPVTSTVVYAVSLVLSLRDCYVNGFVYLSAHDILWR